MMYYLMDHTEEGKDKKIFLKEENVSIEEGIISIGKALEVNSTLIHLDLRMSFSFL